MLKRKKINVNKEYAKLCREIAETNDEDELISHFRTHVSKHFIEHKDEGEIGRLIWLVAVFGFANIFKEKFKEKYKINTGDMLFECCIHFKEHKGKPIPSFDVDKFLREHRGKVRDYYYRPARRKKWQSKKLPDKMGFHESVVPQVLDGKICTWRIRDHKLEKGDVVAFENSQTGEIFGQGEITKVVKTSVGEIDLKDKTHYKTYENRQELIVAFKKHNPGYEINNDTPVYAYTYKFNPVKVKISK